MGIHNWDKKYHAGIRSVKKAAMSRENKEMILEFAEELMVEGISKPRIVKYLSSLKVIASCLGKSFDCVTKEDLKGFVARLYQNNKHFLNFFSYLLCNVKCTSQDFQISHIIRLKLLVCAVRSLSES